MKKIYFNGYLTLRDDGMYYLSGNRLLSGQIVEVKIGDGFHEHIVEYLGEGDYILRPTGDGTICRGFKKARIDVRHFELLHLSHSSHRNSNNYNFLTKFINDSTETVSNKEFKGLLRMIDLITLYGTTKGLAVKIASAEKDVTQSFLTNWLREMPIASKQEKENSSSSGLLTSMDRNIATKFKNRMEIESL